MSIPTNLLSSVISRAQVDAYLKDEGLTLPSGTGDEAALTMATKVSGASLHQSKMSAFVINATKGAIDANTLTAILRENFPSRRVSDRHGAHYLSLSRTGKLAGAKYKADLAGRTSSKEELSALRDIVESIRNAKNMTEVKALLNAFDNPPADK